MPKESAERQTPMQDFLNPNSMLTPGMAGGLTMLITNALCQHFPLPNGLTGLGISFMFGLLVFVAAGPMWQRSVYYLLNSLIIFCVAAGASGFGAGVATTDDEVLSSLLIRPAYGGEAIAKETDTLQSLKRQNRALKKQVAELQTQLETLRRDKGTPRARAPLTRGLTAASQGAVAAKNTPNFLVATARGGLTRVPRLLNQDYRSAANRLSKAGLRVGKVRQRPSSKSSGVVIRQSPPAGARVRPGTIVHLEVTARKKFFKKWF